MAKTSTTAGRFSRRSMLKTAASIAGLAAGSRAITGFPAVHAPGTRNVLRYLGTAVNQSSTTIAEKVKEDTRHHHPIHCGRAPTT